MAFPPSFLEELRARLPLSDVVGRRVRLTRAGREFKAPCPFHNEKTPSFYVNDQKGFFHCFGCGAHGDVVGFVMRHDNLSFPEAVEMLAGLAGLPVPRQDDEERERHKREKTLHDLVERACRWFEERLTVSSGKQARDYLTSRGIDAETAARFRLGYAPADGSLLRRRLLDEGFTDADLETAGLTRRPDDGRSPYSFFRHRLMFPVGDRRGRIVAFGGRIMEGDGPKYINTGETPLFHKGSLLYNLSRARQAAADGRPVIVAEGYVDVIALVTAGFEGAVAPLGTALTETQIQELWKLIPAAEKEPILCFDGDGAGRRAAWRAVERILPHIGAGKSARVAFLPEGEDPDSLIRAKGGKAFQEVLSAAIPLAEAVWRMETETRRSDSPEAKAAIKAALDHRVETIADPTVRMFYQTEMRSRVATAFAPPPRERGPFRVDTGFRGRWEPPRRHIPGTPGRRTSPGPEHPIRDRGVADREGIAERLLLAALLNHPEMFDEVGESLGLTPFTPGPNEDLRRALLARLGDEERDERGLDGAELCRHLCSNGFAATLDVLLGDETYVHGAFARPRTPLNEVRGGWWITWRGLHADHVRAELREAERVFNLDASEVNFARVRALTREVARLGLGGLEDDDPGFG